MKQVPAAEFQAIATKRFWLPNEVSRKRGWNTEDRREKRHHAATRAVQPESNEQNRWNRNHLECRSDFESGIQQFIVLRDGQESRACGEAIGKFGRRYFSP